MPTGGHEQLLPEVAYLAYLHAEVGQDAEDLLPRSPHTLVASIRATLGAAWGYLGVRVDERQKGLEVTPPEGVVGAI
jgi:hypothetical protein